MKRAILLVHNNLYNNNHCHKINKSRLKINLLGSLSMMNDLLV